MFLRAIRRWFAPAPPIRRPRCRPGLEVLEERALPAFPGANGLIAFEAAGDVFVMRPDGSGRTNLTSSPGRDSSPAWSADGARLAFVSERDGNSEIYVMNADGSGQTRLTNNAAEDLNPAWSPDGTQLVFASHRDGNSEIYVMNADGSGHTRLTHNVAADLD